MEEILKALGAEFQTRIDAAREEGLAQGREEGREEGQKTLADAIRLTLEGTTTTGPRPFTMTRQHAGETRKQRRNSWEGISATQRLARVNAIRRGKGLEPRRS